MLIETHMEDTSGWTISFDELNYTSHNFSDDSGIGSNESHDMMQKPIGRSVMIHDEPEVCPDQCLILSDIEIHDRR